jgi:DNA-binding transcriptional LysR family regulator
VLGALDSLAAARGTSPTRLLEDLIMTTASTTFRLATDEERAAWVLGNNDGAGYAPSAEQEAGVRALLSGEGYADDGMPGPTQPEESESDAVLVSVDGKTGIADSNGWWAVDIGPYLA